MRPHIASLTTVLLILSAVAAPVQAAEEKSAIRVALLDMSSTMPMGMMGMVPPGMMGRGMMRGMMFIRIDKATAKAGDVAFDVTNWSRSILHEMLVIAVDNPTAPLPYDYSQARVAEDQVKVLGEVEDLQPNISKTVELALGPGSYLLICNVPGHYAAGMVMPLNVTP